MTKTNSKNNNLIKRSLSRLIAVQTIYQYDFYKGEEEITNLMDDLLDNYVLDEDNNDEQNIPYRQRVDLKFLEKILSGIILIIPQIDQEIQSNLKEGRKIEELKEVLLSILRMAIFELKFIKNIPQKVIISEYVDIAGCFFDEKQVNFVNSILDKIAQNSRTENDSE